MPLTSPSGARPPRLVSLPHSDRSPVRVSNDNPFSEAAFKTLKYTPVFPESFGSLADARAFCESFFR